MVSSTGCRSVLVCLFCSILALPCVPGHALEWRQEARTYGASLCFGEGPEQELWAGDARGRVWRLGGEDPEQVYSRRDHPVTALFVEADGTLWVGWDDGVSRCTTDEPPGWDQWDWVAIKPSFVSAAYLVAEKGPMGKIDCIARTQKGIVAASKTQGLMSLAERYRLWDVYWAHFWGPNSPWLDLRELLPGKRIHAILEDDNGYVWFATANGVLMIERPSMVYSQRRSGYYSGDQGKPKPPMPGSRFTAESHGLPSNEVLSVASQPGVGTWFGFGGEGGVAFCRRGEEWRVTRPGEDGLPPGAVTSLAADGDGRLWAAVEKAEERQADWTRLLEADIVGRLDLPRGLHSQLAWTRGEEWHTEPRPKQEGQDWPFIHDLLCSSSGKLLLCTGTAVWSTPVKPPLATPEAAETVQAPRGPGESATPIELPEAGAAQGLRTYDDPRQLLGAVIERNRPWLLPPTDALRSLQYRFALENAGVQHLFRWEAPFYSSLATTWDRDGAVPDLLERKWVSFDEEVSEAVRGGPPVPLDAARFDPNQYWQDILTGCEVQTILRMYARRPDAFQVHLAEPGMIDGRPTYVVELVPDRSELGKVPYAAARAFLVAWAYDVAALHLSQASVHIDRERLVPLMEQWWWKEKEELTAEVHYLDPHETPGGQSVPAGVSVVRHRQRGEETPAFRARYGWYEPGLWLLLEASQTGRSGDVRAVVSDVRVNADTGLADEVAAQGADVMDRRTQAVEILTEVAERNSPWLSSQLDPMFLEASYRFELRGGDGTLRDLQEVSVTAEGTRRWSAEVLGNTVGIPLAPLLDDPDRFSPIVVAEREEGGRRVYDIRAAAQEWVRVPPCGNGLSGRWYGFFTGGWKQLRCVIDAEKLVPLSVHVGERQQRYDDYQEVAPGRFAPMTVTVPGWFEYRFIWANDCLWIVREAFSGLQREGPPATGRITNLLVNGQPVPGVPTLTADEIRAAREEFEQAEADRQREEDRERRRRDD